MTINDMLRTEERAVVRFKCPFKDCNAPVHMEGVKFGYGIPDDGKDGPGLVIHFQCEELHQWNMEVSDQSRALWVNIIGYYD